MFKFWIVLYIFLFRFKLSVQLDFIRWQKLAEILKEKESNMKFLNFFDKSFDSYFRFEVFRKALNPDDIKNSLIHFDLDHTNINRNFELFSDVERNVIHTGSVTLLHGTSTLKELLVIAYVKFLALFNSIHFLNCSVFYEYVKNYEDNHKHLSKSCDTIYKYLAWFGGIHVLPLKEKILALSGIDKLKDTDNINKKVGKKRRNVFNSIRKYFTAVSRKPEPEKTLQSEPRPEIVNKKYEDFEEIRAGTPIRRDDARKVSTENAFTSLYNLVVYINSYKGHKLKSLDDEKRKGTDAVDIEQEFFEIQWWEERVHFGSHVATLKKFFDGIRFGIEWGQSAISELDHLKPPFEKSIQLWSIAENLVKEFNSGDKMATLSENTARQYEYVSIATRMLRDIELEKLKILEVFSSDKEMRYFKANTESDLTLQYL